MVQDPILRCFELLHRSRPLAPLVVSPERRATVADVAALARAAGSHLAALRLPPGALVGLAAANGPAFLASLLALRRAGLAALLLDAQGPPAEAQRAVAGLGAAALLRCRTGWPRDAADWTLCAAPPGGTVHALPEIAVVKLTSGSTGAPRGIAAPADALLADDANLTATMGLGAGDRFLATVPLAHSYGLSSLALPALLRGALLVVPAEGSALDPFALAAATGATVFPTTPAYLDALLRACGSPLRPASLRLVIAAGAPLAPATARRFRAACGLAVHVFYGASECGGICYDRTGEAGERGTVGSPVEGVRVALQPLASDDGSAGEGGVVTVESAAVARGYLPEADARLAGSRFTGGDTAVWRGGELALRGRLDDLINIKGKKVNPREVEGVLGQLSGVEEVAVLAVPRPGCAGAVLRAVIACRPGRLSAEEVLAWCRPRLSPHKVPRSVVLVPEMPRTSRGKLDRPALLALDGAAAAR
jgi:acyl-coenzyme A synthetase/AMP-(fatty) acid ligase